MFYNLGPILDIECKKLTVPLQVMFINRSRAAKKLAIHS